MHSQKQLHHTLTEDTLCDTSHKADESKFQFWRNGHSPEDGTYRKSRWIKLSRFVDQMDPL